MSVAYNPLSGNFETKEPGPQGPAGTVSAAGDGSQGTPSISFASDTNTGLYKYAADSIGVSTGGTNRLVITSSGRLGINETSPDYRLHTKETTTADNYVFIENTTTGNAGVRIKNSSADYLLLASDSSLRFYNVGTSSESARIDSSGNVGIGTSSPGYLLDVKRSSAGDVVAFTGSTDGGRPLKFISADNGIFLGAQWTRDIGSGSGIHAWSINGTERMRIDSSGRLLVGTTSAPAGTDAQYSKLAVRSNTLNDNAAYLSLGNNKTTTNTTSDDNLGIITFNDNDSDAGEYARITGATDGANGTNDYPGKLIFSTTADGAATPTERMRIDSSGNVGIGRTPSALFDVDVNGTALHIGFGANYDNYFTSGSSGVQIFRTGTTERMRITSAGKLLVGKTASGSNNAVLQVAGTSTAQIVAQNTSTGSAHALFQNSTTGDAGNAGFYVGLDGNKGYVWNYENDAVVIGTASTERMRIDSSGRIGFGVSTMVGGASDVTIIRNSALRWADNDGTQRADIYGDSSSNIVFRNGTSSTERMRIASNGLVSVSGGFQVTQNVTPTSGYGVEIFTPSSTVGQIQAFNRLGNTWMDFILKGKTQQFYANGSERMRIDSAGNVGIGTTSPEEILHVAAASEAVENRDGVLFQSTSSLASDTGLPLVFTSHIGTLANYGVASIAGRKENATSGNAAGYLQFATGSSAGAVSEKVRIDSSGRLLVGTSSNRTGGLLQVESAGASAPRVHGLIHNEANSHSTVFRLLKTRGTAVGAVTAVQNDDALGFIAFSGTDGTNVVDGAYISALVDGTPGTNDLPTHLAFSTTADGASSPTERMRIGNAGNITTFSSTTGTIDASTSSAAGTTNTIFRGYYGATSIISAATLSFRVYSNGNVQNTNNSYGAISDAKLKENIVDATSQWDDIKDLRVRNYNFIEGQTHTQIGVVAQEVEVVSPGLVTESPDLDAEGNDLGTTTKSVNYSVLYMKAVKALQEAMDRIETLETKVAALEAG